MQRAKEQVRRFYEILWNDHALGNMASILHADVTFRGSLGDQKRGHDGFAEYVDKVHDALAEYRCVIDELVAERDKVFAKMSFGGIHRGDFMGYGGTGERVEWAGCALFTFDGELIRDVWVLGDLKNLEEALAQNVARSRGISRCR